MAPTAYYACEVWGLRHMVAECRTERNKIDANYTQMLRELCGVRRSVPAAVIQQELCQRPLAVEWRRLSMRFWNAPAFLPATSIFRQIAQDDIMAAQQFGVRNWAAGLLDCAADAGMQLAAPNDGLGLADDDAVRAAADAAAALERQRHAVFNPRTAPSDGAKHTTYAVWFSRPEWARGHDFWQIFLSAPQLRAIMRFRLGSHMLPVETGRFDNTPRLERVCTFCDSGAVGDEQHLLMECAATAAVRHRFRGLFDMAPPPCMQQLIWCGDRMHVALFILSCLREVGLIGSA